MKSSKIKLVVVSLLLGIMVAPQTCRAVTPNLDVSSTTGACAGRYLVSAECTEKFLEKRYSDGVVHRINGDGTSELILPSKIVVKRYSKGNIDIIRKNRTADIISLDENVAIGYTLDFDVTVNWPNGVLAIINPVGDIIIVREDGTEYVIKYHGITGIKYVGENIEVALPSGKLMTIYWNGTAVVH